MITEKNPRGAGMKKIYKNGTEPFITTIPKGTREEVIKAINKIREDFLVNNEIIINAKANGLIN